MNPFDLRGPEFLLFYIVFTIIVLAALRWLRRAREKGLAPMRIKLRQRLWQQRRRWGRRLRRRLWWRMRWVWRMIEHRHNEALEFSHESL